MDVQSSHYVLNSYASFSLDTRPSSVFSIHAEYPGLEEIEIEPDKDEWFHKNTQSFKCFAQVMVSRSSLIFHPLFHFPPLEDPGIDEAFNYIEPEPIYDDNVGCTKYLDMCKQFEIVPISRICKYLPTGILNLKFYGLSPKQIIALSEALKINVFVNELILQDNWLPLESITVVSAMLEVNNIIQVLNLRECRIGPEGAKFFNDAIVTSQRLTDVDISYNSLGDAGLLALKIGLKENTSVKKLNISHNNFTEDSAETMESILKENRTIEDLDLSWSGYYTPPATKKVFNGLTKNESIRILNLSWNGLSEPKAMAPLLKYMKSTEILEDLDLSWNRLTGPALGLVRRSVNKNNSLKVLKIGNNKIKPDEAFNLANMLVKKPELEFIDMENIWFNKNFLALQTKIKNLEKHINIGGIYSNYTIKGPDELKLLFDRCRYLLQKPKKKKAKKDFSHFILKLLDEKVSRDQFDALLKKEKMKKLDKDLLNSLWSKFKDKKDNINGVAIKEIYMKYYPDACLPPPKPKKEKKKKGKRGKKGKKDKKDKKGLEEKIVDYLTSDAEEDQSEAELATETKATEDDYTTEDEDVFKHDDYNEYEDDEEEEHLEYSGEGAISQVFEEGNEEESVYAAEEDDEENKTAEESKMKDANEGEELKKDIEVLEEQEEEGIEPEIAEEV